MIGFMQGFYEETILAQTDEAAVVRRASKMAIELAMMGMAEEANNLLILAGVTEAKQTTRTISVLFGSQLQFFLAESQIRGSDGLDEQTLRELASIAKKYLPHLPEGITFHDVSEESYASLSKFAKKIEESTSSNATTGYDAMRLSSALAGLLWMAKDLGHEEDVPDLMKQIAGRIHCNQQSMYLASVRFIWKEYLLSGWLRKELDVSLESMQEYAYLIATTIKKRLDQGPLRPEDVYSSYSTKQLLDELDHNTVSHPGFREEEFAGYLEEEHGKIESILQKPATTEEIGQAEIRIGRSLPEDLKEVMKITNGCLRVKTSPLPVFQLRLPPLDDITFEDEEYMSDYVFTLLPDIDLGIEIEWPGIEDGGIAVYENDGQGTDYVWFLSETLVEKTKKHLQEAFNAADSTQRAAISKAIDRVYGSREIFDNMKTCLYLQGWGEPSGQIVWPTFRSYLTWVVFKSRDMEEHSPLNVLSDVL